jgi:hypothetical protein
MFVFAVTGLWAHLITPNVLDTGFLVYGQTAGGGGPSPGVEQRVTSLSPSSVLVGSRDVTLTVIGSGFTEDSRVVVESQGPPTTFISSSQLRATLTSSFFSVARTLLVGVNTLGFASATIPLNVVTRLPAGNPALFPGWRVPELR